MRAFVLIVVLVVAFLVQNVGLHACGDKLLLVGWGQRFSEIYAAIRPGNVVIYAPGTRKQGKNPLQDRRLHKGLKTAGHQVTFASTAGELSAALRTARVDVVLAIDAHADAVRADLASASSKPSLLRLGDGTNAPASVERNNAGDGTQTKGGKFSVYTAIEELMKERAAAGLWRPAQ